VGAARAGARFAHYVIDYITRGKLASYLTTTPQKSEQRYHRHPRAVPSGTRRIAPARGEPHGMTNGDFEVPCPRIFHVFFSISWKFSEPFLRLRARSDRRSGSVLTLMAFAAGDLLAGDLPALLALLPPALDGVAFAAGAGFFTAGDFFKAGDFFTAGDLACLGTTAAGDAGAETCAGLVAGAGAGAECSGAAVAPGSLKADIGEGCFLGDGR